MKKFISILVIIFFLMPLFSMAATFNSFGGAFGGKILSVIPCTCSFALMLYIGPPVGGTFIYQLGVSTLYKNYAPVTGHWALGTSSGRISCWIYSGTSCITIGNGSIIRKLGTS